MKHKFFPLWFLGDFLKNEIRIHFLSVFSLETSNAMWLLNGHWSQTGRGSAGWLWQLAGSQSKVWRVWYLPRPLLPVGSVTINMTHVVHQENSDATEHPVGWPCPAEAELLSSLPPCVPPPCSPGAQHSTSGLFGAWAQLRANPELGDFILDYSPWASQML